VDLYVCRAWHTRCRRVHRDGRKDNANKVRAFPEMGCLKEA
jgi:hypothetical protein